MIFERDSVVSAMTREKATRPRHRGTGWRWRPSCRPCLWRRHELASAPDVLGHGSGEGCGRVESLLVAEPGPELDGERLAVELAREVEQIGLDVDRFPAERRIGPHADGC